MRVLYPTIEIIGNERVEAKQFFNAIRFSTHGEFLVSGCGQLTSHLNFPHMQVLNSEDNDRRADFSIKFKEFGFYYIEQKEFFFDVSRVFCEKHFTCIGKSFPHQIKKIDFIRNPDGRLEFICAIGYDGRPVWNSVGFEVFSNYFGIDDLWKEKWVLTLSIDLTKINGKVYATVEANKVNKHWELYRSIGINLPLLIIQVLLGRNIKTLPLVDQTDLRFDKEKVYYLLESKCNVWFDLDETLICRGQPIDPVIAVLRKLKVLPGNINLLTRHKTDIDETLENIGLTGEYFDDVIRVADDQNKSAWIGPRDIFIDNEFPQRADVRIRSKAMVLDLDQIDFLP